MARAFAGRTGRTGRPVPSARKANAAGYAKRQSLKAKVGHLADVYEHQQHKVRRDKVKLALDRDELADLGIDGGSDDEGFDRDALRARLIGENVDDEMIDSADDEEIDSDGAFDEGDEEQFAGFSFRNKKAARKQNLKKLEEARLPEVDLNEDSDGLDEEGIANSGESENEDGEDDEGDPGEFFDVLDVLDGRGGDLLEETMGNTDGVEMRRKENMSEDESERDEDDEEEGASGDEESDAALSADDDDINEDAVEGLGKFVSLLETGSKRKADDADDDTQRRKRRVIAERTQAGPESEFTPYSNSGKLQLDDLLAPLTSSNDHVLSLKKSANILSSTKVAKTLSAPLALRAQERLDREAAYEQTKGEVSKWNDTMKQIREAEHLSFPLQAKPAGKTSNLELTAKFQPTTALESSIDKLLKKAQMREEDLAQTETLKMNHLSAEEVAARRAEVRKTRELMFRAEVKAKRMAKIKSKTYRRIKKKARERHAEAGDDLEDDDEARMKFELSRARERATLRHKSRGKWAKAMRDRGELDDEQQQDVLEMLDRGEKLRRRIRGQKDSDASDEESSEDGDAEVDDLKARAFEELEGLKNVGENGDSNGSKGKGVFDMKFMRDAAAREQREVNRQIDDFMHELGGSASGSEGEEEDASGRDPTASSSQRIGGRISFQPGLQAIPTTTSTPADAPDLVALTAEPLEPLSSASSKPVTALATTPNPWLTGSSSSQYAGPKRSEIAVGKNSAAAVKSKNKLGKRKRLEESEREKAMDDAILDIGEDDLMTLPEAGPSKAASPTQSKSKAKGKAKVTQPETNAGDSDSDSNSEIEEQELILSAKGKGKATANSTRAFEQRELVARAFAGDNVVQEFEEAKRREMDADAPKEVDTTLPGWGSWGGSGVRRQAPRPWLIKKVAGIDPTSRADHGKKHIIISEKRDKKAAKYLVKDLPYPYTSKAQFDRSLATPIGTEWNTRVGFQRATLPKVTKKMGVVINPLQKRT